MKSFQECNLREILVAKLQLSGNIISSCMHDYEIKKVKYLEWLVKLVEGVRLYGCGVHPSGCLKSEVAGHNKLALGILIKLLQVRSTR